MPFDGFHRPTRTDLEVLKAARDGVRRGWIQHHWGDDGWDQHCIVGWVRRFASSDADGDRIAGVYVYPALPLVSRILLALPGRRPRNYAGRVVRYNDGFWRTQRQADQLMERAVALAECRR